MQTDIHPADLWPAILSGLRSIDWRESASVFFDGLAILTVLSIHAAYRSGYKLGRWLHITNDRLASLWRSAWAPQEPMQEPMQEPVRAPIPVRPITAYRVSELRSLARAAGLPRTLSHRGRKADLIAALAY